MYFMNEKFNKNAEVEKITTMLGIAVRLIVIDPYDLFLPFFIKVVVNNRKAYSFLIIGIMHLQKSITFSYNAAILFFHC